jgi:hypothetical protein
MEFILHSLKFTDGFGHFNIFSGEKSMKLPFSNSKFKKMLSLRDGTGNYKEAA